MPLTANTRDKEHHKRTYYQTLSFVQRSYVEFILSACPKDVYTIIFDFDEYIQQKQLMFRMIGGFPRKDVLFKIRYGFIESLTNENMNYILSSKFATSENYFTDNHLNPNGAIFLG